MLFGFKSLIARRCMAGIYTFMHGVFDHNQIISYTAVSAWGYYTVFISSIYRRGDTGIYRTINNI